MGRYNDALEILFRSLKYYETEFAYKWIGQILLINNKLKEGIVYLDKAFSMGTRDLQLYYNLARAYLMIGNYNKANQIISSDKWIFEGAENGGNLGLSNVSHHDYREHVISTFKKNMELFSRENKPYTIEAFSDEFFELWGRGDKVKDVFERDIQLGGKFSFCYIDGNHTYEYAKRDFENVNKNLDVGGYILFDDSSDADPFGLTKLMKEIKNNKDYKMVMKNPNYLFMKLA